MDKTELNALKLLYHELIQGYSYVEELGVYIRHSSELENAAIIQQREKLRKKYIKDGLPTEAESLQRILDDGTWTKADDDNIAQLKYIISDNEKNVTKIIAAQQAGIRAIIQQKKDELVVAMLKKKQLMNLTVEDAVEEDMMGFIAYVHIYKDETLKIKLFDTWEEFNEQDTDKLNEYVECVNDIVNKFTDEAMRKISVCPFFLNPFTYCKDDISRFLGLPLAHLTYNQQSLFSLGSRNMNLLIHSEVEPPNMYMDDITIQNVCDWFDQQYSVMLGKRHATKKR